MSLLQVLLTMSVVVVSIGAQQQGPIQTSARNVDECAHRRFGSALNFDVHKSCPSPPFRSWSESSVPIRTSPIQEVLDRVEHRNLQLLGSGNFQVGSVRQPRQPDQSVKGVQHSQVQCNPILPSRNVEMELLGELDHKVG